MKPIILLLGAAAAVLATPAFAADGDGATMERTAADLAPSDWVWNDYAGTGPLNVVVSLADQRAYVYRGDTIVAVSSVSTGRDGKETPTGTFPILQKEKAHKSNLYHSASMPYMERLTWDGVAIHAGATPGFPTSHGCVHVPTGFAKKLFSETRVGTVVNVTDASVLQDNGYQMPSDIYADAQAEAEAMKTNTADANTAEYSDISDANLSR